MEQLGEEIVDLRSVLFTVAEQELKSMAKQSTIKYADRERQRQKNTWVQFAKNYLPFVFKKSQEEQNIEEMKSMMKEQVDDNKQNQKFNKYLLSMNVNINQLMFSFIGGTSEQEIEFQNKLNGLRLQVDSYGNTISAKMRLKSFVFNFIKNLRVSGGKDGEQLNFNILKSTVPENGDFFKLDFEQVGNEN